MQPLKCLLAQPALVLLGLVSFLATQVSPAALEPLSLLAKRQAGNSTGFTPIVGDPARVVSRQSITTLKDQFPDRYNILLLAWHSVAARVEANDTSYYQVAGIHGRPYQPWQYPDSATENPFYGYCTHASVLFMTWHRPYLVLFEQLLRQEALVIANRFDNSSRTQWLTAANNVRLPYWDWASKGVEARIPSILIDESVPVTRPGPDGAPQSTSIPNPLRSYRFLQDHSDWGVGEETVRRDSGQFDFGESTRDATYQALRLATYNDYQSNAEGIHGGVHVDVGGGMSFVSVSAFDPIFWLHHSNVDRLWAMWQATHPGVYLQPEPGSPTFALSGDGQDTITTPLYPFRNANGQEWNSDQIKRAEDIFTYGYAYPEVPQGRSTESLRRFTCRQINRLYGEPQTSDRKVAASFRGLASGAARVPNARREWTANVLFKPSELRGPHRIRFYLGNELVGRLGVFTDDKPDAGGDRQANFTVPLTRGLVDRNIALRAEEAAPALSGDLRWEIEKVGGGNVALESVPSLKVIVSSAIVDLGNDPEELPTVSNVLTHFAPTAGKTGGLQRAEPAPIGEKAPERLDTPTLEVAPAPVGVE